MSFVVWIPVELVTPTEIGSSGTQSYWTEITRERSRPSVGSPSTSKGTIASSTVTDAIVRSSRCGFVTRMWISPGWNSTRRMSNSSAGGGLSPISPVIDPPAAVKSATTAVSRTSGDERPEPPAAVRDGRLGPRRHQSLTSKNAIQPSSANSDWWAWNMNRPVFVKSISMIPRWPWVWTIVSVYSNWSPVPVG